MDLARHQHPRAARAALPAEAEGRARHAERRLGQVGGAGDDCGVLAAHLADRRARVLPREAVEDLHPGRVRARERQPIEAAVAVQPLPQPLVGNRQQLQRARRDARPAEQLMNRQAAQVAVRRGLGNDRVARDQRCRDRPQQQCHREVEGPDHRPHAVGPHEAPAALGAGRAHLGDEALVGGHLSQYQSISTTHSSTSPSASSNGLPIS